MARKTTSPTKPIVLEDFEREILLRPLRIEDFDALILLDLSWTEDPWNVSRQEAFLEADLELARELLADDAERLRELEVLVAVSPARSDPWSFPEEADADDVRVLEETTIEFCLTIDEPHMRRGVFTHALQRVDVNEQRIRREGLGGKKTKNKV